MTNRRKIILAKNYIRSCNNNPHDIEYEPVRFWSTEELLLAYDAWFNGGIEKCSV